MAIPDGRTVMPVSAYSSNTAFMQLSDTPVSKVPLTAVTRGPQGMQAASTATIIMAPLPTPAESRASPLLGSYSSSDVVCVSPSPAKTGTDHQVSEESANNAQAKEWSTEQTVELIQLYRKYLPEFHKSGQRKMNVWQLVTEEMVAKGYAGLSWAEYSFKFRELRDSYRRMTTGGRSQSWPYYALMRDVMKAEKTILEQAPSVRKQKGTITCENETRTHSLLLAPADASGTVSIQWMPNPAPLASVQNAVRGGNIVAGANRLAVSRHPLTSVSQPLDESLNVVTREDSLYTGTDNGSRKRLMPETSSPSTSCKISKDAAEQGDVSAMQRNISGEPVKVNGEPVKVNGKQAASSLEVLGSLQAFGRNLCLPQSQLLVTDNGQVVQTTSTPTGLFINEAGCLSTSSQPLQAKQTMPQWFKLYEKRTRAENNRRLEELKEMHRESLQLQRQALEVAQQKNELLKNLADSLTEFKSLLAVLHK